ncbi:hypothetical protein EGI11_05075 [Chryseobacterium sp. H3056]|uniref:Uncharacterized protein n=1 Tax=Kaistella daneshvariae TaxID=2487074 RepID=A0A3N0WV08_9FLAO|nr:hypothetical protein EGI11_05075 [Kaistella daneshvariae]
MFVKNLCDPGVKNFNHKGTKNLETNFKSSNKQLAKSTIYNLKLYFGKRSAFAHDKKFVCQKSLRSWRKNFNHKRHKAFFKVRTESLNKLRASSNF